MKILDFEKHLLAKKFDPAKSVLVVEHARKLSGREMIISVVFFPFRFLGACVQWCISKLVWK